MRNSKIIICIFSAIFLIFSFLISKSSDEAENNSPFYITVSTEEYTEKIHCWKSKKDEYYIFLPCYTDLAQAKIYLNTYDSIMVDGIALKDGMSCEDFEADKPYSLSYSTFGKSHESSLIFLNSGNVASMYIDTESGNMDYIHYKKGNKESGKLRLYNYDGSINYNGDLIYIKGRGNNTWEAFDKKPYSLSLQKDADLLGMGKAQNWILLSNSADISNLRNKIVYDFVKNTGLKYSPDSEWVNLYLNGEFVGLYLLCERNEVHSERIDISPQNSLLVSLEIEHRLIAQNYFYFSTYKNQALRLHYPKNISNTDLEKYINIWQSAENAILSPDGIDKATKEEWTDLIDLDSWARKYLVEEIFGNLDGYAASQFFYIDGIGDGKIYSGPVWDYDKSMGNSSDEFWSITDPRVLIVTRYGEVGALKNPWISALYDKEPFKTRVAELFEKEFTPLVNTLIKEKISVYKEEIDIASYINSLRWDYNNPEKSLSIETDSIIEYIKAHTQFLSEIWLEKKAVCQVSITNLSNDYFCTVPVGSCLKKIPEIASDKELYYYDTDQPFDITKPITEDISIYAKWQPNSSDKADDIIKLIPLAFFAVIFIIIFIVGIKHIKNGR